MTVAAFDRRPAVPTPLAQPGRNCRCVVDAARFGVAVDGEEYFRALHHVLCRARHSILLVGWEFDSRTSLLRDGGTAEGPGRIADHRIGALLDHLVRRNPGLRVHVLIWDSAMIYAFNREFAGL